MAEGQSQEDPKLQVEAARKAFEHEFERFARFAENSETLRALDLSSAALEQRALAEVRTRHLGKKSALSASKKMIGIGTWRVVTGMEHTQVFRQRTVMNDPRETMCGNRLAVD